MFSIIQKLIPNYYHNKFLYTIHTYFFDMLHNYCHRILHVHI